MYGAFKMDQTELAFIPRLFEEYVQVFIVTDDKLGYLESLYEEYFLFDLPLGPTLKDVGWTGQFIF